MDAVPEMDQGIEVTNDIDMKDSQHDEIQKPGEFHHVQIQFLFGLSIDNWPELLKKLKDTTAVRLHKKSPNEKEAEDHEVLEWIADNLRNKKGIASTKTFRAEAKGTRSYIKRYNPFIDIVFSFDKLTIEHWTSMPNVQPLLEGKEILVSPTLRLYSSGCGFLRLKTSFATTDGHDLMHEHIKATLGVTEEEPSVEKVKERIRAFDSRQTTVDSPLTPDMVIEISNLDRGQRREDLPILKWNQSDPSAKGNNLYAYFVHVINERLANSLKTVYQTADVGGLPSQLLFDKWYVKEEQDERQDLELEREQDGQHPYVSIYIPYYEERDKDQSVSQLKEQFKTRINRQRELMRMLLRTSWTHIRQDWSPLKQAIENLFYSDLLHISVHLRASLCYHFLPTSKETFTEYPGLLHSYKYREELNNIICAQRLLWYAYNLYDHKVTEDMKKHSQTFHSLMDQVKSEHFRSVIEGLKNVVTNIDDRKNELAQLMVDPQGRKGGSSMFTEILDQTAKSFGLSELHTNLNYKIERLDMIGIHIGEALHEASQIRVADGTRSTQLTLELIEAVIVGFYMSEIAHGLKFGGSLWHQSWLFPLIGLTVFLTSLPWITWIRLTLSKFPTVEPPWLKRMMEFGAVVGPLILFSIAGTVVYQNNKSLPIMWVPISLVFILLWIVLAKLWFVLRKYEEDKLKQKSESR